MPAVIVFFAVLPAYFASQRSDAPMTIAVHDSSGLFVSGLRAALSRVGAGRPIQLLDMTASGCDFHEDASNLVRKGMIYGFIDLSDETARARSFLLHTMEKVEPADLDRLEVALQGVLPDMERTRMDVDNPEAGQWSKPIQLDVAHLDFSGGVSLYQYLSGLVLVMMLFFAVFNSGGGFMRGLLEEKSNKVIEMLASSVSPNELMTGKLLGIGLIGLLQIGLWFLVGVLLGNSSMYSFISWSMFGYLVTYFALGYLFFASCLSILGALFSADHDIQHLQGLVAFVGILPLAFAFLVLDDPDSPLVNILSYVPPLTPTLMILRIAVSDPPWFHLVGTVAVMFLSIGLVLRMAGRVFEMQIAQTGRRLTWPLLAASRRTITG